MSHKRKDCDKSYGDNREDSGAQLGNSKTSGDGNAHFPYHAAVASPSRRKAQRSVQQEVTTNNQNQNDLNFGQLVAAALRGNHTSGGLHHGTASSIPLLQQPPVHAFSLMGQDQGKLSVKKMTEEKRERKREINRLSAQRKRERERIQLDTLTDSYAKTNYTNEALKADNDRMTSLLGSLQDILLKFKKGSNSTLSSVVKDCPKPTEGQDIADDTQVNVKPTVNHKETNHPPTSLLKESCLNHKNTTPAMNTQLQLFNSRLELAGQVRSVLHQSANCNPPARLDGIDPETGSAAKSSENPFKQTTLILYKKISIIEQARDKVCRTIQTLFYPDLPLHKIGQRHTANTATAKDASVPTSPSVMERFTNMSSLIGTFPQLDTNTYDVPYVSRTKIQPASTATRAVSNQAGNETINLMTSVSPTVTSTVTDPMQILVQALLMQSNKSNSNNNSSTNASTPTIYPNTNVFPLSIDSTGDTMAGSANANILQGVLSALTRQADQSIRPSGVSSSTTVAESLASMLQLQSVQSIPLQNTTGAGLAHGSYHSMNASNARPTNTTNSGPDFSALSALLQILSSGQSQTL